MGSVKTREYCSLHCGNCYRSPVMAPEARFFTCARCGDPAFECKRCVRVGVEGGFASVTTCATCSLREEMHTDAS
jgi:hypothetical protein